MGMSIFQFTKSQRVTIPAAMAGAENVQGLVAEGHAELGAEPRYIVQWPNAEKFGDNGLFGMLIGEVGQGELIKAQPPKMISEDQADERAKRAHENGRRLERDLIALDRENRVMARLRNKRKSTRKRTRK
jgi:hypothetical protein